MLNKVRRYIKDPYYALGYDMIKKHPHWMSDKYYLSVLWKMVMGYKLDWKHPKTFCEKLQWLKLHDRKPEYTIMVDKYRMKQWAADKIGEQHIIPTLAVYNSVDEIDLNELPDQFVLKCNHDSGSVVICKDKTTFDLNIAKKKLGESLKKNFFWEAREWPYKNVKPCLFAEAYLLPSLDNKDLTDYKFFCFNGEPKLMYIGSDRSDFPTTNFFDMDFVPLHLYIKDPPSTSIPKMPNGFEEMKLLSKKLSQGIPQVRVDFYECGNDIFLGEMTFFHNGGLTEVHPKEWNEKMGDWIKLPCNK